MVKLRGSKAGYICKVGSLKTLTLTASMGSASTTLTPMQQTINRNYNPSEKRINQMKNLIPFLRFLEQPLLIASM